jgi:hypothetical protein
MGLFKKIKLLQILNEWKKCRVTFSGWKLSIVHPEIYMDINYVSNAEVSNFS